MSHVTECFDLLNARLLALFPEAEDYFKITNPYDLTQNSSQFLRQGWGLAVGPGNNSNRELDCSITINREYRVVLTRALESLELNVDTKDVVVKTLLEDAFDVIADFEREVRLDDDKYNVLFISDTGIQNLQGDDFSIIMVEMTFNVEIFDRL